MKISIIVPVYNVEQYISQCLNSLINQTEQDIEIILIDDGSTDKSGDICDEYAKYDKRISVMHQKNKGQSVARNKGLEIARGEYIMFVDSDDYIAEDACKILYIAAISNKADIVNADILNEKNKIQNSDFRKIDHENMAISTGVFLREKIETMTYDIVPWLYFVKRDLINRSKIRFLEGCFYEDQLWTLQLLSLDGNIIKIRYPFYFYRMDRVNSTTNHIYLKKGKDAAIVCNNMKKYIDKLADSFYKKYYNMVLLISVNQFINVWLKLNKKERKKCLKAIDKQTIEEALKFNFTYKSLHKTVKSFYRYRHYFAFKYDVKCVIRKFLGR